MSKRGHVMMGLEPGATRGTGGSAGSVSMSEVQEPSNYIRNGKAAGVDGRCTEIDTLGRR